jgi:hypothetical protein
MWIRCSDKWGVLKAHQQQSTEEVPQKFAAGAEEEKYTI